MPPDIATPSITANMVLRFWTFSTHAPNVPVHAPVMGSGIATNTAMPNAPYLFMPGDNFSRARPMKRVKNFSYHDIFKKSLCRVERKTQHTGATSALQAAAKGHAAYHGMLFTMAKGIPPRNSEIGKNEKNAVHKSTVKVVMATSIEKKPSVKKAL